MSAVKIRLLIQVNNAVSTAINWADKAEFCNSYQSQHFGHLRVEWEGFSKGESDVQDDRASHSCQSCYKMLSAISGQICSICCDAYSGEARFES
jgi:hypothetical protein